MPLGGGVSARPSSGCEAPALVPCICCVVVVSDVFSVAPLFAVSCFHVYSRGAVCRHLADSSPPGSPPSHPLPLHVSSPEEPPAASTPKEYLVDVANMLKAFIGLNVMYTSYAFSKAGLIRGIVGLLIVTYLTEHCCLLLIDVKNGLPASALHRRRMNAAAAADAAAGGSTATVGAESIDDPHGEGGGYTYADIAGAVLGPAGDAFVSASLVLTQFGYCVGYLIFMSQTVHDLVASAGSPVWAYVLVPLPLLAGLSLLRSIRSLGPFSMLANLALMAGVVAVIVYIGDHFRWAPSHPSLASLPLFFGQMTAAIEGIGLVVPVESSMRRPSEFAGVLRSALAVLTVVLAVVGVLGFVTFGEDTRSIILLNMVRCGDVTEGCQEMALRGRRCGLGLLWAALRANVECVEHVSLVLTTYGASPLSPLFLSSLIVAFPVAAVNLCPCSSPPTERKRPCFNRQDCAGRWHPLHLSTAAGTRHPGPRDMDGVGLTL